MQDVFSVTSPLVLVGCGNMGHAMAQGWLKAGLGTDCLYVLDPRADAPRLPGVAADHFVLNTGDLPDGLKARVLVLAVKPQMMNEVLAQVACVVGEDTLVLSVAAGVTLGALAQGIGVRATYVRAMPNTPAAIGAGITGLAGDADMTDENRDLAQQLMQAVGEAVWVSDEALIDAVTAVSGSGPAYVFHMVESMAAAGIAVGLQADTAMKLARQTIIGAARLLETEKDVPAAELRRRVTSPAGTTAAALDVLMATEAGLGELMGRTVSAAHARGQELGKGS